MPILKKTMLREYELRGRESEDALNDNSIYFIARGLVASLTKKGIEDCVVGMDARTT